MMCHEVQEGMRVSYQASPILRVTGVVLKVGNKGVPYVRNPRPDVILVQTESNPDGVWILSRSITEVR